MGRHRPVWSSDHPHSPREASPRAPSEPPRARSKGSAGWGCSIGPRPAGARSLALSGFRPRRACGELLRLVEPGKTGPKVQLPFGPDPQFGRTAAADALPPYPNTKTRPMGRRGLAKLGTEQRRDLLELLDGRHRQPTDSSTHPFLRLSVSACEWRPKTTLDSGEGNHRVRRGEDRSDAEWPSVAKPTTIPATAKSARWCARTHKLTGFCRPADHPCTTTEAATRYGCQWRENHV
jgi:hypothetical protein